MGGGGGGGRAKVGGRRGGGVGQSLEVNEKIVIEVTFVYLASGRISITGDLFVLDRVLHWLPTRR